MLRAQNAKLEQLTHDLMEQVAEQSPNAGTSSSRAQEQDPDVAEAQSVLQRQAVSEARRAMREVGQLRQQLTQLAEDKEAHAFCHLSFANPEHRRKVLCQTVPSRDLPAAGAPSTQTACCG